MTDAVGTVMNTNFTPTKRGRKPLIDVHEFIPTIDNADGNWVRWVLPANHARSLSRQLGRIQGYEVTLEGANDDEVRVYARRA